MANSLTRPLTSPLTRPLTSAVTEGVGGALSAFSAAKYAIQQDAADVNILVIGDSTGNATDEWVYLFGQWLATEYPTHSVSYRVWNDATPAYDTAVSLGTGSGSNTIRIWNASVAGITPLYLMGSKLSAAVTDTTPNVVIWNHGHNLYSVSGDQDSLRRGGFLDGMEQVRLALPGVPHAAFRQNPRRDDDLLAPVIQELDGLASDYGDMPLLDAYSAFVAAGKPAGWYADAVHPNATGQQAFVSAITSRWRLSSIRAFSAEPAFLSVTGSNLLVNSDFASGYGGGTPAGWTVAGSPTATVDTGIKDAGATQSMKIVGATGGSGYYQAVGAAQLEALRGNKATLAVRQYVPAGSPASAGRIALFYNDGAAVSVTGSFGAIAQAGWRWQFISGLDIPANVNYVRVYLYCDTAANTTSAAYYDRAILVAGDIPRDL